MELIVALLMIINGEIKEHRIQISMSDCLKGKRIAILLPLRQSDIDICILCSLISPFIIISKATINSINELHYH